MEADRLRSDKVKLALDTSFLILMAEKRLKRLDELTDWIGRYEPVVLNPVSMELKRLGEKGSRAARLAYELSKGWEIGYGKGLKADDALLSYAKEFDAIVATLDGGLIKRLKENGLRFLSLKGDELYLG